MIDPSQEDLAARVRQLTGGNGADVGRLDIRGYIDTARKHRLGACDVLHQLMTGNPWLLAQPISP